METALRELPLVLFTAFGPMAAGAFLGLLVVFWRDAFTNAQINRLDRLTIIPVLLALTGLGFALFHLFDPDHLNDPARVLDAADIMTIPALTAEALCYAAFLVLAVAYWVAALTGGLERREVRLGFCLVVTMAGLAAVIFMGFVSLTADVPAWNAPKAVAQLVAAWLFGGAALTMLMGALCGNHSHSVFSDEMTCKVFTIVGAVVFVVVTTVAFFTGSVSVSPGADMVKNAQSLVDAFAQSLVFALASALCGFFGKGRGRPPAFVGCAIFAAASIVLGRLVFYGMQAMSGM